MRLTGPWSLEEIARAESAQRNSTYAVDCLCCGVLHCGDNSCCYGMPEHAEDCHAALVLGLLREGQPAFCRLCGKRLNGFERTFFDLPCDDCEKQQ